MGFLFEHSTSTPPPDPFAVGAALCRLLEQSEPASQQLFSDPVVESLLGARALPAKQAGLATMLSRELEGTAPGLHGSQVCRTRYIDDAVLAALGRGITQVAIIGAGYDTRAYRLPGIDAARVVEFDLPATLAHKRDALQERFGALPEHVTYRELDLESPSVAAALADAGIVPTEPALVICEGVTQYVSAEAVDRLLEAMGTLCPGSELIFTYVLEGVVRERDGFADAAQSLARGGPRWIFGIRAARVPSLLEQFGLSLIEDVGAGEFRERYLLPIDRRLNVSAYERIVRAAVAAPIPA